MNIREWILHWVLLLDPIPSKFYASATEFQAEGESIFRQIMRATGAFVVVYNLTSALLSFYLLHATHLIVYLYPLVYIFAGFFLIIISYKRQKLQKLYAEFFDVQIVILVIALGEFVFTNESPGLVIISLIFALISIAIPWPTLWTVGLQTITLFLCLSLCMYIFFEDNESFVFMVFPLVIPTSILSIFLHHVLLCQRWEGFLHRQLAQKLNENLQETNRQMQILMDRFQSDLNLARQIQQGLLPAPVPSKFGLDLVCYSQSARQVGGDFYHYHTFRNGKLALAVGDVSGKGVASALLMATSLSLLIASFAHSFSPGERLAQLDQVLTPYTKPQRQNCALCYLEVTDETLKVVNAGGIPPFIQRANGSVEFPEVGGFALGQGLGAKLGYTELQLPLKRGDLIILTSDGVVEAKSATGELWGFERLTQALARGPRVSSQAMLDHSLRELKSFTGETELHDDLTIMIAQI